MNQSPIFEALQPSGAAFGVYSGVETAARFTSTEEEFNSLLSGCAIYDLGWRAKLIVRGKDRTRWLNGMITNTIKDLPAGRGNYSFVLTHQGRIQGDLYAYNRGESIVLDTDANQVETLKAIFKKYIIMDDVQVEDVSRQMVAVGVQGPDSRAVLAKAGIEIGAIEPMQILDITWRQSSISVTRMVNERFETYELWIASDNAPALWKALLAAGGTPVGTETLEKFRVFMGMPKYGIDIRERDLPQETKQDQALNFTKGCYIGQEIVERIRSRGAVHRQFSGFLVHGQPPPPGAKILADGKEVGEITSVATVPSTRGEQMLALGYIRREAASGGPQLTYEGGTLTVSTLPFNLEL